MFPSEKINILNVFEIHLYLHLHLHLHLVIWQTLLSKATYNWDLQFIATYNLYHAKYTTNIFKYLCTL